MLSSPPVSLINMPFGPLYAPSIGLSLLQAQLKKANIASDIRYYSIAFAKLCGEHIYAELSDGFPTTISLTGEWIFSHALFPDRKENEDEFFDQVLRPQFAVHGSGRSFESFTSNLREIRAEASVFVNSCAWEIVDSGCLLAGFTSLFQQHAASLAVASRIKKLKPEIYLVMGGANCEDFMGIETLRQFPFIDAVVSGEGERTFQQLVEDFLDGRDTQRLIPGVHRRQAGLISLNHSKRRPSSFSSYLPDMDTLPIPDFREYLDQSQRHGIKYEEIRLLFESSRGCWWGEKHHCTFCGLNGGAMKFRCKSPQRALEELKYFSEAFSVTKFSAVDNIMPQQYFDSLLPALAKLDLPMELFYEVKSNLKKKHLQLLKEAGVTSLQPGIESLSSEVLSLMRKGVSRLQNLQTLKWCKEFGIKVAWNILWGFPGEHASEYESMEALIPLCEHLPPPLGVRRIRMDRFSPNFAASDQLGFRDVRPAMAYRFIYPFSEAVLTNLSYYFDYDVCPELNEPDIVPIERLTGAWQEKFAGSELLAVDDGSSLIMIDLRSVAIQNVTVLKGAERRILLACDEIRSRNWLLKALTAEAAENDEHTVDYALAQLQNLGLITREGENFLSLAVVLGEYQPSAYILSRFMQLDETRVVHENVTTGVWKTLRNGRTVDRVKGLMRLKDEGLCD